MDRAERQKILEGVGQHYRAYYESAQERFPAALLKVSQGEKIASLREIAGIKTDILSAIRNVGSTDVAVLFNDMDMARLSYPEQRLYQLHLLYRDVPDKLLREREDYRKAGYVILDHAQSARRHEKHDTMGYVARILMGDRGILGSSSYMSHMEGVFDNARQISEIQARTCGYDIPYEASLAEFMPGVKGTEYMSLVEDIFHHLPGLRRDVLHEQAHHNEPLALPDFSPEQGQKLVDLISELLPVKDETYRTYMLAGIPSMCMGNIATIRYTPDPLVLAETAFHERTGHLTYRSNAEQAGGINGFHMDEARALSLERFFLRDYGVIQQLSEIIQKAYGAEHEALSPENLFVHTRWIDPGLAERVSSDDLTYLIQETIRGRAEMRVMNGELKVSEMPDFMAAETEEAFGISGLNGYHVMRETFQWPLCMQGHMASYPTGMVIAAQLDQQAKEVLGESYSDISKGTESPYFKFMADRVDSKGMTISPGKIIEEATGQPFLARKAFEAYIYEKKWHPELVSGSRGKKDDIENLAPGS